MANFWQKHELYFIYNKITLDPVKSWTGSEQKIVHRHGWVLAVNVLKDKNIGYKTTFNEDQEKTENDVWEWLWN